MIVVLDTNIWLKELALNTGAGSALRFFLRHRSARLALPEVVRLEVQNNLRRTIEEAIESVAKGNRQLLTLFGSMKEVVLPTQQEIDKLVSDVFSRLGVEILDLPFSIESARSSFLKTVARVPPSDKTQEFKDGVLWANCLELLDEDDVLFATQDKAFCHHREFGKGLAANLLEEASPKTKTITLVHSITDVLNHVKTDITFDDQWLASSIKNNAHTSIDTLLSSAGATKSGSSRIQYDLFITENPNILYMKYTIEIPCADIESADRTNMSLVLRGSGTLKSSLPEVLSAHATEEILRFTNPDGSSGQLGNAYATANLEFGHRTITHSVSYPLSTPFRDSPRLNERNAPA